MKIIKFKNITKKDYQRIINRSFGQNEEIKDKVQQIISQVKEYGDRVILEKYQSRYGRENYQNIQVTPKEIRDAYKKVNREIITALRQMAKNISIVHRNQLQKRKEKPVYPENGISVWREWRAIEKVGLYIPGGKAVYPSSLLMSAIPAKIAGCSEIVICSPPAEDGCIPAVVLVASDIARVNKIFKVGGAQAIAAMAYGTENIPAVYKIFGAGNSYVTMAKMLVLGKVAIDMPAGPSEVFIIADESANPKNIAADLLADGEHGDDSACVLVTISEKVASETVKELEKQLKDLPTQSRALNSLKKYGAIILADTLKEAVDFANDYAPEHIGIMVKRPETITRKIMNTGSVFIGDWTSKSSGDYATGANHVLPTSQNAKMYPPLGVDAFGRFIQFQKCTKSGLARIRKTIELVAEVEKLPAHKIATSIRF